jgi:hypothetical protein
MFASGGHSGQVLVIGIPSMRLLKVIGVFTPEPWQGYGFGEKGTLEVLAEGFARGKPILWGDTHHPALSETEGEYDGQFLFINVGLTQLAGREPHIWRVIGQNTPYMAVRMTQLGPNCVTPTTTRPTPAWQ